MWISTNLIPWPGPQTIRVMLIPVVLSLTAIQSSPISIAKQMHERHKTQLGVYEFFILLEVLENVVRI